MQIRSQSLPNLPQPFEMIPVEGGIFNMGDEHGDLWEACQPVHRVKVSDFYIGKYPVTQALWKAVMNGENPSEFKDNYHPLEQVSWDEIKKRFLPELHKLTELDYRLPTETEWEYAARGGKYYTEGCKYAGSDRLKDVGWFDKNVNRQTKPVGLKNPNQLGIYDMSGNVWEWCEDWMGTDYYEKCEKKGIVENPFGPEKGTARVYRGGSWLLGERFCRAAYRNSLEPSRRLNYLGFRLALSLQ